ncbi:hypothetical protein K1T71_001655 [Dendrolimus kikuchii]|uniref:Uncharacterized protein n=1 Tax=Dendrolimus kikuchii TaxID=765133 RepID=A0ACC1DEP0_9NEOP|nr:hypothetical protein K1T71_001655 [Dendrolimus kikuchii]
MEEELNEQDIEEKLYAMLHHVDQTQTNATIDQNTIQIIENTPRSTLRRYWRTSGDVNPYHKTNTISEFSSNKNVIQNIKQTEHVTNKNVLNPKPNENKNLLNTKQNENKNVPISKQNDNKNIGTVKQNQDNQNSTKPKAEKSKSPLPAVDLSLFQTPPQNCKKVIEILDHDIGNQVILESSDEDEVIEVVLPPKPTITIESSDEDELQVVQLNTELTNQPKPQEKPIERDISTSPVPSVVSSVSDEFIRGDCIALKISSRHPDNHSFDFSLHGPDLLHQSTPSKKKKKKKNKETMTSTPVVQSTEKAVSDECFATPKSKAKNKKPKRKTYTVSSNSIPSVDVYDSDSNQSVVEMNKANSYVVTEKSLPNADVYESDSNQSETIREKSNNIIHDVDSSESGSVDKNIEALKNSKRNDTNDADETFNTISLVDLTDNDLYTTFDEDETGICENIVMGNVTGFTESDCYGDENINVNQNNVSMFGSTKVPAILNADLDFDNLKGKDKVCRRRRYSLTTLRAEMEKFYNESWGGEDFNHREIQKSMSRDKSLWAIDPKDRMMSPMAKKKVTCNYCNRAGHRDDTCRMKPPICYMCGSTGHFEPRCPRKICVNCGSPNYMYSSMCTNCRHWGSITCAECGQCGHPATHCPDLWRRYHNTIDANMSLQRNQHTKKHYHLFCSGCTKRGHLVHTCRNTIPFSGLPINTPYVCFYRPIYPNIPENNENTANKRNKSTSQDSTVSSASTPRNDNKRQCKSPNVHETHMNKKRNVSLPVNDTVKTDSAVTQRKLSLSDDCSKKNKETPKNAGNDKQEGEKAPDFIPITPSNQDEKGNMIQDNEVSDTSSVITSARIYVTNDIIDKLKTKDGQHWLKEITEKYDVNIQNGDVNFLNIRGKVTDQEVFQNEFRKWAKSKTEKENDSNEIEVMKENQTGLCNLGLLPKNRKQLIKTLNKAFASLQNELGDPNKLYKELTFLQNQKEKLLMKKDISPKQVSNNRSHINRQLKALNMVLIGQAGLADGTQHLNELHLLQQKLKNSNELLISPEERMEILAHYSSIFGPIYRDDYMELLNTYYKSSSIYKKKNKERSLQVVPKKKHIISIPSQPANSELCDDKNKNEKLIGVNKNAHIKKKLIFYHRRLLSARPIGADLKKKRGELVRRLHSFIASSSANMTSKKLRKIKKIQEQVQMFLVHV